MARERAYYGAMVGRYLFDTGRWDEVELWNSPEGVEIPTPHYHFARTYAALKEGNLELANQRRIWIRPITEGNTEIALNAPLVEVMHKQLDVLFARADGNMTLAIQLAREAIALEASLPFRYGHPQVEKPTGELLGDLLLEAGDSQGSIDAYRDQLKLAARRTDTLLGLAKAATSLGDTLTADETYHQVNKIRHSADPELPKNLASTPPKT